MIYDLLYEPPLWAPPCSEQQRERHMERAKELNTTVAMIADYSVMFPCEGLLLSLLLAGLPGDDSGTGAEPGLCCARDDADGAPCSVRHDVGLVVHFGRTIAAMPMVRRRPFMKAARHKPPDGTDPEEDFAGRALQKLHPALVHHPQRMWHVAGHAGFCPPVHIRLPTADVSDLVLSAVEACQKDVYTHCLRTVACSLLRERPPKDTTTTAVGEDEDDDAGDADVYGGEALTLHLEEFQRQFIGAAWSEFDACPTFLVDALVAVPPTKLPPAHSMSRILRCRGKHLPIVREIYSRYYPHVLLQEGKAPASSTNRRKNTAAVSRQEIAQRLQLAEDMFHFAIHGLSTEVLDFVCGIWQKTVLNNTAKKLIVWCLETGNLRGLEHIVRSAPPVLADDSGADPLSPWQVFVGQTDIIFAAVRAPTGASFLSFFVTELDLDLASVAPAQYTSREIGGDNIWHQCAGGKKPSEQVPDKTLDFLASAFHVPQSIQFVPPSEGEPSTFEVIPLLSTVEEGVQYDGYEWLEAQNGIGHTPFHRAVGYGPAKLVQFYLSRCGEDPLSFENHPLCTWATGSSGTADTNTDRGCAGLGDVRQEGARPGGPLMTALIGLATEKGTIFQLLFHAVQERYGREKALQAVTVIPLGESRSILGVAIARNLSHVLEFVASEEPYLDLGTLVVQRSDTEESGGQEEEERLTAWELANQSCAYRVNAFLEQWSLAKHTGEDAESS